ncbi:poly(A) RNA polymerase, mitochondrial isoform X2 [Orussus abietinus]|uniref:poly(A) RNA polymerase, mitochondrial isoform X2 n=1 Tax=Orussus abietinus TaxID=222816 RepID=UPI0006259791|nr:poly(A) RNA polymerase, mitochondrial isoform X2 [Orussus abietinus]
MSLFMCVCVNFCRSTNNPYSKLIMNKTGFRLCSKFYRTFTTSACQRRNSRKANTENVENLPHVPLKNNNKKSRFKMFDNFLEEKKAQANRSIIVQVLSQKSGSELYQYCLGTCKVRNMYHYSTHHSEHFYLVELASINDKSTLLSKATHCNRDELLPTSGNILWFRNLNSEKVKQLPTKLPITRLFATNQISDDQMVKQLSTANSISDQMTLYHKLVKLNDIGVRLRFLTAQQFEFYFSGFFPNVMAFPFGSSVNGFGKMGCDLDLVAILDASTENLNSRLVYHSKSFSKEKFHSRKLMDLIATSMEQVIPGISNVKRIFQAKVPIIKFDHRYAGLECDLSMSQMTAVYMSELLYIYGAIDPRVKPLAFTVRKWAQSQQLTKNTPGPWITNFSLILLVIFYLQHAQILPPLQYLIATATKEDTRVTDSCVNCTFVRNVNNLEWRIKNAESLHDLLQGFFQYYSNFNFGLKGISLEVGHEIAKPDNSSPGMYIKNPLEPWLNVSKNVSVDQVERLRSAFKLASQIFHVNRENHQRWGLLALFTDLKGGKDSSVDCIHNILQENDDNEGDESITSEPEDLAFKSRARPR